MGTIRTQECELAHCWRSTRVAQDYDFNISGTAYFRFGSFLDRNGRPRPTAGPLPTVRQTRGTPLPTVRQTRGTPLQTRGTPLPTVRQAATA